MRCDDGRQSTRGVAVSEGRLSLVRECEAVESRGRCLPHELALTPSATATADQHRKGLRLSDAVADLRERVSEVG